MLSSEEQIDMLKELIVELIGAGMELKEVARNHELECGAACGTFFAQRTRWNAAANLAARTLEEM